MQNLSLRKSDIRINKGNESTRNTVTWKVSNVKNQRKNSINTQPFFLSSEEMNKRKAIFSIATFSAYRANTDMMSNWTIQVKKLVFVFFSYKWLDNMVKMFMSKPSLIINNLA